MCDAYKDMFFLDTLVVLSVIIGFFDPENIGLVLSIKFIDWLEAKRVKSIYFVYFWKSKMATTLVSVQMPTLIFRFSIP